MAKPKLTVTFPDGTKGTRQTDRVYTHVFVTKGGPENVWGAYSWHGNIDRALAAMTAFLGREATATYQRGPGERWYYEAGSARVLPVDS